VIGRGERRGDERRDGGGVSYEEERRGRWVGRESKSQ
jgi:hypothetical protein